MVARNMQSNVAVNKDLHIAASRWISSTQNYDARNHDYKIDQISIYSSIYALVSCLKNNIKIYIKTAPTYFGAVAHVGVVLM